MKKKNYAKSLVKAQGFGSTKAKRIKSFADRVWRSIDQGHRAILGIIHDETSGVDNGEFHFGYSLGNSFLFDEPHPATLTFYPSAQTSFIHNIIGDALVSGEIERFAPGEVRELTGFLGPEDSPLPVRARLLTDPELIHSHSHFTIQCPNQAEVLLLELPDPAGNFAEDEACLSEVKEAMANAAFRVGSL